MGKGIAAQLNVTAVTGIRTPVPRVIYPTELSPHPGMGVEVLVVVVVRVCGCWVIGVISGCVYGCERCLLFYVPATSNVISGWVPTCDSAHS